MILTFVADSPVCRAGMILLGNDLFIAQQHSAKVVLSCCSEMIFPPFSWRSDTGLSGSVCGLLPAISNVGLDRFSSFPSRF